MLEYYAYYIFTAFLIACWAYVYIYILCEKGGALVWWYRWLMAIGSDCGKNATCSCKSNKWYWQLWYKVRYPLTECSHCHAGQVALWAYFYQHGFVNYHWTDVPWHIGYIALTVMIVELFIILRTWMKMNQRSRPQ